MGYHPMTHTDMYEIVRRWHDGQSISSIGRTENRDRKSVREVIRKTQEVGVTRETPLPGREILGEVFEAWKKKTERKREVYDEFSKHEEEIKNMIEGTEEVQKVKPKTAYLVLLEKYGVNGSYGTFKIFIRKKGLRLTGKESVSRMELPPGQEVQIDYGRAGLMPEGHDGKKRVVNGFLMTLSHSRHLFIEFTYTQKTEEFARSVRNGLEFYGGVPERLNLDNLKAGVIKPDLYDPKLNRTFQELVEHYGTFADPCRIATATDKGKVERMVPVSRELFRFLRHTHPTAGLIELNRLAREWCLNTYGMRNHGTTHEKPKEVFEAIEKAALKPLPAERFEITKWKQATVGPDQFLQFEYKYYSMPAKYVGRRLWVRKRDRMVGIYEEFIKLREYVIPRGRWAYLPEDFPKGKAEMMHGRYPSYLTIEARDMGPSAGALMEMILRTHAYLKARRGRGVLNVMTKYKDERFFEKICREAIERKIEIPQVLEQMMKNEADQMELLPEPLPMSEEGRAMVRDPNYYTQEDIAYESEASFGGGAEKVETVGHGTEP